ncbi:MAG: S8 family serine peptidase [Labilithrix sp.]|nr:S8 family serine peptidase [Labilithrix sp.]MCW5810108.1 S8 family serine peptidase [Labilithrix sp.]
MKRLALALALSLLGCESTGLSPLVEEEVTYECPSRPPSGRPRMLIVDTQLDPTLPELAPSIAGCYRFECDDAGESCAVVPGVKLRRRKTTRRTPPDPAAWNAALAQKRAPDGLVATMEYPIFGVGPEGDHGTAVASAAMYGLAGVDLLFLQVPLRRETEAIECPSASEIDEEIRKATDPVARAERVGAPLSPEEREYVELMRRERIDVSNESFGSSRPELEVACPNLRWREYFEAEGRVVREREAALDAQGAFAGIAVTVVKAAGNDGAYVTSLADVDYCHEDRTGGFGAGSKTIVVGSYDVDDLTLSFFTNHGPCVDVYAPGSRILVPDANGILRLTYGTSLAAPLVTRLIATLPRDPPAATVARVRALAKNKMLPLSLFPPGLLFDDKTTPRALPRR